MKVQSSTSFSPVKLEITLENELELEVFFWMLSFDYSIPDMVYKSNEIKQEKISDIMSTLHHELRKHVI